MRVAITGHRPDKLGGDYNLSSQLIKNIKAAIIVEINSLEATQLITGMALGIDTLFAQIAIELNIPFIAAIPCFNQDKMWVESSKIVYNSLLNNPLCTKVVVSEVDYNSACMQTRNEYMVNECDFLIAVWNGTSGGTANCISYAKQKNKPMLLINPINYK